MQCQSCNRDIPDDAVLCPYCGQTVSRVEPPPPSAPPAPRRTTGRLWMLIALVAGLAIAACLVCFICGVIGTSTPEYKATQTAKAVARQTVAARPTDTPIPTSTPVSITYADIQYNYDTLTDIQWASYEQGLRGTRVRWVGEVEQVKGDRTTYLDFGQGLFSRCYLDGLSAEEAASLSKGDIIEFEATIRKVERILGLSVYLHDPVIISRR